VTRHGTREQHDLLAARNAARVRSGDYTAIDIHGRSASARYFELFPRLVAVLHSRPEGGATLQVVMSGAAAQSPPNDHVPDDDTPFDALEWLDIDAILARQASGAIPNNLEARVALHPSLFDQPLSAIERAPA
jgi:hypothetical protein